MSTDYRKNKVLVYGQYVSKEDASIINAAVSLAARNIGVTNNRKSRLALIEISRHYLLSGDLKPLFNKKK